MANTLKLGAGKWATGKDTVLSFNDENGNFKPLPFDFSRASSATVVNQSGLIETVGSGEPRIDFLGNTKGALLLEPSRTNLITQSEAFDNSYWTKSGSSVVGGFASPSADSPLGAFKLVATNNDPYIYKTGLNVTANTQTASIYVKGVGSSIGKEGRILFWYIGTAGGTTLSVPFTFTSDWQRVQGSSTPTSGGTIALRIDLPDVSVVGEEVLIYGAQLEQGSYPTSYIPTSGQSGGVTRVRDLSDTQNLSHVIGQTEGVIFYDAILIHKSTDTSEDLFELSIDDGSNQNIFFINNYNNGLTVAMVNGGSYQFTNNSFNPTEGARYKLAFAYKQNDFALYINGTQIATDLSGTVPTMNQITFGNYYNNQSNLSNSVKINDLKLYNTRLSNSELAALTTI